MQPPDRPPVLRPRGRDLPPPLPPPRSCRGPAGAASSSFWFATGLGILGSMFGVVAIGGVSVLTFGRRDQSVQVAVAPDPNAQKLPPTIAAPGNNKTATAVNATDVPSPMTDTVEPVADPANKAAAQEPVAVAVNAPASDKPAAPASDPAARPLDDVRQRKDLLPIAGDGVAEDQVTLCRLGQVAAKDVKLELVYNEFDDPSGTTLELLRREQEQTASWEVTQRATKGLGRPEKPGRFMLANGELRFQWNSGTNRNYLPFCGLRITVQGAGEPDSEVCRLWKPIVVRDARINFDKPTSVVELVPPKTPLPPSDGLRLEVDVENWPKHDFKDDKTLAPGQSTEVVLINPDEAAASSRLKIRFEFRVDRGVTQLNLTSRAKTSRVKVRASNIEIKQAEEPFATTDLPRIKTESEKTTKNIELLIERKVDPSIELAQRQLTKLMQQQFATPRAVINKAEKNLEELQSQRELLDEALKTLEELGEWSHSVAEACAEIEEKGRLQLRLSRQVRNGESIEILGTLKAK